MALGESLLTEFNGGGTHETSPLGGIPQGIGANGQPNLVEEGETRMGDFIFSDRLTLDDGLISAFNLPKKLKGKSFADASKVINKHSKDNLESKIDMDTSKELLERLQSANDMMKEAIAPKEAPGNINAYGGKMYNNGGGLYGGDTNLAQNINLINQGQGVDKSLAGVGGIEGVAQGAKGGPGIGSVLGAATTGLDLFNTAKGNTSTDTTGSAISGALKGAGAGAAFGPLGAGIGGVIGLGAGIIGSKKAQENASEERENSLHKQVNLNNLSAFGGNLSKGAMPFAYGNGGNLYDNGGDTRSPELALNTLDPQGAINLTPNPSGASLTLPTGQAPLAENPTFGQRAGNALGSAKEFLGNNAELLRYAPIVTNALQLANLDDADIETRDRIGKKYKPQFVDEAALVNQANEAFGSTREALQAVSGGDAGSLRSNLVAANIGRTKGLSDARLKAEDINRSERRAGQQFDLGVDRFNVSQSNLEKDVNARNEGQRDTQKSKLISALGENIGAVGLEQLRKKYPERMGLLYNSDGSFNKEGYAALSAVYNKDKKKSKKKS